MKFKIWGAALGIGALGLAGAVYTYSQSEWYGFDVLMRRGGSFWVDSSVDDPRLTPSMRLAMQEKLPEVKAGAVVWRELAKGFETAEISVIAGDKVVDRILLNRIDPALYRLSVHNQTKGFRDLGQWEEALPKAALIVNGSYFSKTGTPSTPFISEGEFIGVKPYDAKAGAFVANAEGIHVIDLSGGKGWEKAFENAQNAMVSYPLLVGEDGQNHVSVKSNWLANRTFVAEDRQGRILIGTTEDAFFSLYRLGEFLRNTPLDIKVALNLDGGPVACQSVRVRGFKRHFIAQWESQADSNRENVKLLTWPFGNRGTWAMAVVLVATPK